MTQVADGRTEALSALIGQHLSSNAEESRSRERVLELLLSPGAMDRDSFDPGHITASAFIIDADEWRLLLVHHIKLDKWLQPGGHIETTDTDIDAAARREVAEETGLVALDPLGLVDLDVHSIPARGTEPAHSHFDVRLAYVSPTSLAVPGDGVRDVRWEALSDVADWMDRPSLRRPAVRLLRLAADL